MVYQEYVIYYLNHLTGRWAIVCNNFAQVSFAFVFQTAHKSVIDNASIYPSWNQSDRQFVLSNRIPSVYQITDRQKRNSWTLAVV